MTIDPLSVRYPKRARLWKLRTQVLELPKHPLLMGIVNVTPDSFSDGGHYSDTKQAIEHAYKLLAEGADLLDIGGESTRPYATPVTEDEELRRVLPVVQELCRHTKIPVSIDTSKANVAQAALDAGAEIVNDVTALSGDPNMLAVVQKANAAVCAMHMQGTPQTMQNHPQYEHVVEDIYLYLQQRRNALLEAGIHASSICLDPGIGFGKTHEQNMQLAAHCDRFHELGCPILVGHSRKGFLSKVLGSNQLPSDVLSRDNATLGMTLALARQGIQIVRVHAVQAIREALLAFQAIGGIDGQHLKLS
jgi:dihydropteroate synthase